MVTSFILGFVFVGMWAFLFAPIAQQMCQLDIGIDMLSALGNGNDVIKRRRVMVGPLQVLINWLSTDTALPVITFADNSKVDQISIGGVVASAPNEAKQMIMDTLCFMGTCCRAIHALSALKGTATLFTPVDWRSLWLGFVSRVRAFTRTISSAFCLFGNKRFAAMFACADVFWASMLFVKGISTFIRTKAGMVRFHSGVKLLIALFTYLVHATIIILWWYQVKIVLRDRFQFFQNFIDIMVPGHEQSCARARELEHAIWS